MSRHTLFSGLTIYRGYYDPGFVVQFADGKVYYVCDPNDTSGPEMIESSILPADVEIDEAEYTDELWTRLITALLMRG